MSKQLTDEQQLAALDRLACVRGRGRGSRGYQANWRDRQRDEDLKYGRPADAPEAQGGQAVPATAPGTDLAPAAGEREGGEP